MPPPQRTQYPTGHDAWQWVVTDDGSRTLWDAGLGETYHSGCGAVAETLIVYLWHSGVLQRLRQRLPTTVLEFGLGTGTGMLLTAALAEHYQTPLRFISLEKTLLPVAILQQLELATATANCLSGGFARTPESDPGFMVTEMGQLATLSDSFCRAVEQWQRDGATGYCAQQLSEYVELQLWLGDACAWRVTSQPADPPTSEPAEHVQVKLGTECQLDIQTASRAVRAGSCDAIYFDPFSPETHPELWTLAVFQNAALALRPGGRLTSYCVKSVVRRGMLEAGLHVAKGAGPVGGKREVLIATNPADGLEPAVSGRQDSANDFLAGAKSSSWFARWVVASANRRAISLLGG